MFKFSIRYNFKLLLLTISTNLLIIVYFIILPNKPFSSPVNRFPQKLDIGKVVFIHEHDPRQAEIIPGSPLSIQIIKTQLNSRKLVLFSVNEINLRLEQLNQNCLKFWVNPLDILNFQVFQIEPDKLKYTIQVLIQPGDILIEAEVEKNINIAYLYYGKFEVGKQNELELISATILKSSMNPFYNVNCYNDGSLSETFLKPLCICVPIANPTGDYVSESRTIRNGIDKELISWPPNAPMFVTNYVRFGVKKFYFTSPPNTSDYCNSQLKMLIMISSAPTHFMQRELIRSTYGNKTWLESLGVRILFLFGKVQDTELQTNISAEIQHHNDIVQPEFLDSYHNLTLSHLMMYNWLYTFCNGNVPKWLLKADDDFLINVELSLDLANANPDIIMIGHPFCYNPPIRNVSEFWKSKYTPKYMYAPDHFVCYLSGVSYLIQTEWIPRFLQASLTTPIIHMDDAYIGLLAFQLGVCITEYPKGIGYYNDADKSPCQLKQTICSDLVGKNLHEQWTNLNSPATNCSININLKITSRPQPKNLDDCIFNPR